MSDATNLTEMNQWVEQVTGQESHWKSLDELEKDPQKKEELKKAILGRFPQHFLSRREFMGWMGGLSAVLGLSACTRQPQEKILPYVKKPEDMIPGRPLYFATAYGVGGAAEGLLVESHMGRPTKIDGNPDHPENRGTSSAKSQAAVLDLYDPDRLKTLLYKSIPSTWSSFQLAWKQSQAEKGGGGVRILTQRVISPTLGRQIRAFLKQNPGSKWVQHEAVDNSLEQKGLQASFGQPLRTVLDLENADVILSFESDFLVEGPGCLNNARAFASRRKAESGRSNFNRLYAVESTPTVTGTSADHRIMVRPDEIYPLALVIAKKMGANVPSGAGLIKPEQEKLCEVIATDLLASKGKAVVVAGAYQPAELHTLCAMINSLLGAAGKTVHYYPALEETAGQESTSSLLELVADIEQEVAHTLVILGGNPFYTTSAGQGFQAALSKVPLSIHVSLYENETTKKCSWAIPETHFLEAWSDLKGFDGTVSLVQPLIAPLYASKSVHEVMSVLLGEASKDGSTPVKETWSSLSAGAYRKALHDGVIANTSVQPVSVGRAQGNLPEPEAPQAGRVDLLLRPDPNIGDGSTANNGWLQELPKPLSKVTWENTFYASPKFVERLGALDGDIIEVKVGEQTVKGPIWKFLGQADNTLTAHLGYGRQEGGRLCKGAGFDVYPVRENSETFWLKNVSVKKTSQKTRVACTQLHADMGERDLIRKVDVKKLQAGTHKWPHSHPVHKESTVNMTERPYGDEDYAWGMAIDMSACTGCNACIVACQSENNIAVVGKEEVYNGREMHWLRVDHYYSGEAENPEVDYQPIPCMHCEKAPCEVVCPVGATQHSPEGLNEMTYNRCVGTKYCANNCPYKVRRFNFYQYSDIKTPSLRLGWNPDVTVRARGVMEKCTYCVQRISEARIDAKREGKKIQDGGVKTACQTACPSQAIVFGNLKDQGSRVSKWKQDEANYSLLEGLGTLPRTTYLAKVKNPHPEMEKALNKVDA